MHRTLCDVSLQRVFGFNIEVHQNLAFLSCYYLGNFTRITGRTP